MNRGVRTLVRRAAACAATALISATTSSCAVSSGAARLTVAPATQDTLPYDRWQQKSVHNAYDHVESLGDQLAAHGFRSLEIDIHRGKLGRSRLADDWWVYHHTLSALGGPSCATLSECLAQIEAFHRADPEHDVITVFIDVKDDLDQAPHRPRDLDARLRASLPAGTLLEPGHLRARCPRASSLRDAVAGACTWPTLGELRGRVVVVLTGGDLCGSTPRLGGYLDDRASPHAAFVAPRTSDACGFEEQARDGRVLFFNLDGDSLHQARAIRRAHLVSRAYGGGLAGGVNDPSAWAAALEAGVNILATDRVDAAETPWTNAFAVTPATPARDVAQR